MTMIDVKPFEGHDIAVVSADSVLVKTVDAVEELLRMIRTQGQTALIAINAEAFPLKFWDPQTGFPGKVLNCVVEADMKMAVVGDFSSLADGPFLPFMAECNNGFNLFFVKDEDTAARRLANAVADDKRLNR